MCGILGIWNKTRELDEAAILAARDSMSHRGPDDSGCELFPAQGIALAHRRLSIIDLSADGHQPMLTAEHELAVVFNGEIYNYVELRAELEFHGHVFRSRSDTEVLLHGYRQWGDELLTRLNGMFAFALLETRTGRMLLARDRVGEKPLFYYWDGEVFIFASELKAIFSFSFVQRKVNPSALCDYLAYGYVPREACMVEKVKKLVPGGKLVFQNGAIATGRYWKVPNGPITAVEPQLLVEELESLLRDSMRRQLVADVPVGILLSGGLDSSLVSAIASQALGRSLRTFTVVFPGHRDLDETAHARLMAEFLGTEHHELQACEVGLDLFEKLARQYDEPMADSSMVPMYLVSKLVREHCTVALGGDGGDEMFGGYPHYVRALSIAAVGRHLPDWMRSAVARTAAALPVGVRGRTYFMSLDRIDSEDTLFSTTRFDQHARSRILSKLGQCNFTRTPSPEVVRDSLARYFQTPLSRLAGADFLTYLPDDILVKADRASMLSSLEIRAPLLDYRIIEFAFGKVPDRLKIDGGRKKILLKMLGRKLLPKEFAFERKQGFSIPLASWLQGRWQNEFRDYLAALPTDLFDHAEIEKLWEGNGRQKNNSERIFALALLAVWANAYKVQF